MNLFSVLLFVSTAFAEHKDSQEFAKRSTIQWEKCGIFQCGFIKVPLDHVQHNGKKINISLIKYSAKKNVARKTLIINPGGPEVSGIKFLSERYLLFSKLLDDQVDLVAFDQRGTGNSEKLHCLDGFNGFKQAKSVFKVDFLPSRFAEEDAAVYDKYLKKTIKKCEKEPLLPFLSTSNSVWDLEHIRRELEMDKMNIWSLGYSAILGAAYINYFPKNVGSVILDSVMNPSDYYGEPFAYVVFNSGSFLVQWLMRKMY